MYKFTLLSVLLVFFVSCNNSSPNNPALDSELRALLDKYQISGDPTAGRSLPDVNSEIVQLGKKLFFSKTLSGGGDVACVSCHHPLLGGGDALPLAIGVDAFVADHLGPGRRHADGDFTVPRNSPTTFNIGLWDEVLFWDGRVESIGKNPLTNGAGSGIRTPDTAFGIADGTAGINLTQAQSRFPVTSAEEMKGFGPEFSLNNKEIRLELSSRIADSPAWRMEFSEVFGDQDVSFDRITQAISEYERSQVFINHPFKQYIEGNVQAISEQAKEGALLFYNTPEDGGANCVSCHSGDFFTDESFHRILAPQIGRGKGDGLTGSEDFGRFRETGDAADLYKFRTPSLLNVEITAPYFHAGSHATLKDVIRHHLNPEESLLKFNTADVYPADLKDFDQNTLALLEYLQHVDTPRLYLEDYQIDQLEAFLLSLTDPCIKSQKCLEPWLVNDFTEDSDGSLVRFP